MTDSPPRVEKIPPLVCDGHDPSHYVGIYPLRPKCDAIYCAGWKSIPSVPKEKE